MGAGRCPALHPLLLQFLPLQLVRFNLPLPLLELLLPHSGVLLLRVAALRGRVR